MTRILVLLLAAVMAFPAASYAQAGTAAQSAEPFKVGTFLIGQRRTVGIVLRDALVVDLAQANAAMEKSRSFPRARHAGRHGRRSSPTTRAASRAASTRSSTTSSRATRSTGTRPAYVRELSQVRTLAPIPRPRMIMNTAVNFYSHIAESAPPEQRAKPIAARKANRGVPYMFLKAPSSVIGTGETILIPLRADGTGLGDRAGDGHRPHGRATSPAPKAQDHVFGYTVMLDISDRGGRPPGGFSAGTDWFVMKGQDTFGPMGPFIVPKEFYGDPMAEAEADAARRHRPAAAVRRVGHDPFGLGGASSTPPRSSRCCRATSSAPARRAASAWARRCAAQQVWLVAGDEITATIDGIGTLRHKVEAAPAPPAGTGSYLPPVSSYRQGRGRGGAAQPSGGAGRGAPGK